MTIILVKAIFIVAIFLMNSNEEIVLVTLHIAHKYNERLHCHAHLVQYSHLFLQIQTDEASSLFHLVQKVRHQSHFHSGDIYIELTINCPPYHTKSFVLKV